MKRLVSIILSTAMLFSFAGCVNRGGSHRERAEREDDERISIPEISVNPDSSLIEVLDDDHPELKEALEDITEPVHDFSDVSYLLYRVDENILSFRKSYKDLSSDEQGVIGVGYTLDVNTGEILTLDDFGNNILENSKDIIEEQLNAYHESGINEDIGIEDFDEQTQWVVSANSIVFFINFYMYRVEFDGNNFINKDLRKYDGPMVGVFMTGKYTYDDNTIEVTTGSPYDYYHPVSLTIEGNDKNYVADVTHALTDNGYAQTLISITEDGHFYVYVNFDSFYDESDCKDMLFEVLDGDIELVNITCGIWEYNDLIVNDAFDVIDFITREEGPTPTPTPVPEVPTHSDGIPNIVIGTENKSIKVVDSGYPELEAAIEEITAPQDYASNEVYVLYRVDENLVSFRKTYQVFTAEYAGIVTDSYTLDVNTGRQITLDEIGDNIIENGREELEAGIEFYHNANRNKDITIDDFTERSQWAIDANSIIFFKYDCMYRIHFEGNDFFDEDIVNYEGPMLAIYMDGTYTVNDTTLVSNSGSAYIYGQESYLKINGDNTNYIENIIGKTPEDSYLRSLIYVTDEGKVFIASNYEDWAEESDSVDVVFELEGNSLELIRSEAGSYSTSEYDFNDVASIRAFIDYEPGEK